MTLCNTGILIKAINRVAAALIPPESEKISMNKPKKKLNNKKKLIILSDGIQEYKENVEKGVDIPQEIDIVQDE